MYSFEEKKRLIFNLENSTFAHELFLYCKSPAACYHWPCTVQLRNIRLCPFANFSSSPSQQWNAYVHIYLTSHTCLPKGSLIIKGNLKSKCYNTQASGFVSYQYLMFCCMVAFILSQTCKFKSAFLSSFLLSFLPSFIHSFIHSFSLLHS
jgi:hypothetical protein